MREISCWTIGRYLSWAVGTAWVGAEGEELAEADLAKLGPLTTALLQRVGDGNKKVQQFACSTFAIYAEVCQEYGLDAVFRAPNTAPIFDFLLGALASYQVGCETDA